MTRREPKLQLETVVRDFGGARADGGVSGVSGVSLSIAAGEVACLLGPSGCGKSTTLRIAAGVERQDSGVVSIDGRRVSDDRTHMPPERRSIGLMFQDLALFPHLSVLDNVAFGVRGRGAADRARRELRRVGLAHRADAFPHELSGGEQQRVALARALAPEPSVMLMDEPFSSLDHRLRDEIRDEALTLLKEAGAAVLLVTHDPEEALRMADTVALMRDGRIVQQGAPFDLYYAPVDRRAAAFFSELNILHSVVSDQRAETPFGVFATPGLIDEADVEIIIRPQHLELGFDGAAPSASADVIGAPAAAVVERSRFLGAQSLIELRLSATGERMQATIPGAVLPPAGTPASAWLRRDRCFVFPCAVQSRVASPYLAGAPNANAVEAVDLAARGRQVPPISLCADAADTGPIAGAPSLSRAAAE